MKNYILIIAIGIMFFSCKKEEVNPSISNNDMAKQKTTTQSDSTILNSFFGNYVAIDGTDVNGNYRNFVTQDGGANYYYITKNNIVITQKKSDGTNMYLPLSYNITYTFDVNLNSLTLSNSDSSLVFTLTRDVSTNNVIVKIQQPIRRNLIMV